MFLNVSKKNQSNERGQSCHIDYILVTKTMSIENKTKRQRQDKSLISPYLFFSHFTTTINVFRMIMMMMTFIINLQRQQQQQQ